MDLNKLTYKYKKLDVTMDCYVNKNEDIWFRGKDVAEILGYKRN